MYNTYLYPCLKQGEAASYDINQWIMTRCDVTAQEMIVGQVKFCWILATLGPPWRLAWRLAWRLPWRLSSSATGVSSKPRTEPLFRICVKRKIKRLTNAPCSSIVAPSLPSHGIHPYQSVMDWLLQDGT